MTSPSSPLPATAPTTHAAPAPLGVVVVGTGDWAREALAPALRACPRVRLDACVSPDADQRTRFAADFGIPRSYPDLATALAGEVGAGLLVVSTPDSHHVEALHLACDHRVPVYCEKPLANSAAEAAEIAARADREGLVATVGFSFRYSSAVQRLRADLAAGVLGDPWLVELWEQNPQFHPVVGRPLTWKADPAHAAGGAVFEYGAHVVDLATWLLGEVATVSSQFATVVPGARLDDLAHLQLRFASGVVGTLTTSWVLGGGFPGIAVRVHGSAGRGEVVLGAEPGVEESYTRRDARGEVAETVTFGVATPKWVHSLRHLEDLVAHIDGAADASAATLPSLAQAAHVQAVLNTAVTASDRGLPVTR